MSDCIKTLISHLPCTKFDLACPYADKAGQVRNWKCCGLNPAVKIMGLKECPQVEIARSIWAKGNKGEGI